MKVPRTVIAMGVGAAIGATAGLVVDKKLIEPHCHCPSIDDDDNKELDAAADSLDVPPTGAFVPQP